MLEVFCYHWVFILNHLFFDVSVYFIVICEIKIEIIYFMCSKAVLHYVIVIISFSAKEYYSHWQQLLEMGYCTSTTWKMQIMKWTCADQNIFLQLVLSISLVQPCNYMAVRFSWDFFLFLVGISKIVRFRKFNDNSNTLMSVTLEFSKMMLVLMVWLFQLYNGTFFALQQSTLWQIELL